MEGEHAKRAPRDGSAGMTAPRTADAVIEQLHRLGLSEAAWNGVVTGGDAGIAAVKEVGLPVGFIGTQDDRRILERAGVRLAEDASFTELVAGRSADDWETVMNDVEDDLWSCGVGQQRGSGGDVRGRLFLPTAACPDSSPPAGDTTAMFLGVRQEPACWDHPADVVDCPP